MKRLEACLAVLFSPVLVALPGAVFPPPAAAQLAVYDPVNHIENILQAARALQALDNQLSQLAHEIDMIEKMARDLETLPVNVAHAVIRDRITRIEELIRKAEGIGTSVEAIEQEFDIAFPESYGETGPGSAALLADARARWQASRAAHRHVLLIAAEVGAGNMPDADALSGIVSQSQGAAGNLQALQAGNQISALTAQQLMQIEALIGAGARAEAIDRARELTEAERGRARLSAFLRD
jgi:P-type conjugative transfer protein TrbJ